ncbi:ROK family protein [Actinosynnema pretiosum]|uniref:ROK family protein n=1 Tax=Actinosynnema pretiosum TaxID=42197 RepID=UPI0031CF57EC
MARGNSLVGRALELVHTGRVRVRAELTAALGTTRTTAGAVLAELAGLGLVRVDSSPGAPGDAPGRPSHRIAPAPGGPVALAAQVHVDGYQVALVGLGGEVAARRTRALVVPAEPELVVRAAVREGVRLLRRSGRACVGAGLAVPSAVAEPDGTALNPLHVAWSAGVPVRAIMAAETARAGLPGGADVANDINLGALAEHRHGAGRGAAHLLVVATGRRGVGGALVVDGALYRGGAGLAMEVGHLTVNPSGRPCHCGGRGCLDVEADPLALLAAAGRSPEGSGSPLDRAVALLPERAGDPRVRAAVDGAVDLLGVGLAGLVNVLNPDRVVLGGLHGHLLAAEPERLAAAVAAFGLWGRSGAVPLRRAELRDWSLVGAAERAWQRALDDALRVFGAGG